MKMPRTDRSWVFFLSLTVLALALQAYQRLVSHIPPWGLVWLVGVGNLFALGVVLDRHQPDWPRTLANGLAALGMAFVLLGAGGLLLWQDGLATAALLVGEGLILLIYCSRWATQLGSSYTTTDHILMVLLALLHMALAMLRIWSWRFAFVGDEWGFFEVARVLARGFMGLPWFELRDGNGFHSVFSMELQAWVLQLFGQHVAAWRLSAILPVALSIPAVYVVGHWLGGRQVAVLSGGALAVSHALLCFAMVPYNNTQALIPMTMSMALFVFALRSQSSLRYLLVGMALGSGFIVYGLARLAVIPVGMFWLLSVWPSWQRASRRLLEIGAGALVVAAPILLNGAGWQALLKATPLQSEAAGKLTLVELVTRNVISGLLAFLTNPANTHFVIGPYVDPVTALFVLIGLSHLLVTVGQPRPRRVYLIASLLLLMALSGIQQYERIATTRMFSSVSIFVVYAGIGADWWLNRIGPKPGWLRYVGAAGLLAVWLLVNQYHILRVTLPNSEKPNITLIVQQFQESMGPAGAKLPILVVDPDPLHSRLPLMIDAYQAGPERLLLLTPEQALTTPMLCAAGKDGAMLIVPAVLPQAPAIRNRLAGCWPIYEETALRNRAHVTTLHRFTTGGVGAPELPPEKVR
jgi:hypothetical protein